MQIRKKCIMFVGRSQAGKTTLAQYLTNRQLNYHKTQTVEVIDGHLIDTPGEYVEQRGFYGALSVTAANADAVALVQSAVEEGTMFAPSFGTMFGGKPAVGIVTKIDMATEEQIERADRYLKEAGAAICFKVSSVTGQGMPDLDKWIQAL
ncbi:EutP/PduV family microcompartment system protein [Clostridium aminobutyricum]|uniref:EutP/PduV family microcompartment system protein n=1 Tax=Clostridium aminobutyricum TaxID=33953 RepID=A0A939D9Y6_CLOAM|nr:EutP/PduV family microcompartment system protein [Clostridium aminobutyricum]MBN7773825.1 EutP/PduV family microcompartment system protein [Clostridium aminobutyricum]